MNWKTSCAQSLSHVHLFARQAPLSVEFSRQEYWSELPFSTQKSLYFTKNKEYENKSHTNISGFGGIAVSLKLWTVS